ncbi:hypothetical protein TYRP_011880 [Tyrophagus putrescentiae]|nr:hypothetical protein TYRP_011880 [Tyrophagus putrescentiae]
MTNSKLHSALMITFSIVLLQVPDNGSSQNQTENPEIISSPEPTALFANFVIFGIVIGSVGALMLVSAIALSIHNFFCTESSDNERLTEEAVPYLHHHHHPHGGPPNRAGIGGTAAAAAAAAHSKTPQKKHKRPSKSTGHGKTSAKPRSAKPRSAKPRSKANPFLKLKPASKVCPRSSKVCPKPTSKTSSSGGGSGSSMTSEANGSPHETMITSKCRPSVFFEKLRAKLAKKEKEQNAVKKRRFVKHMFTWALLVSSLFLLGALALAIAAPSAAVSGGAKLLPKKKLSGKGKGKGQARAKDSLSAESAVSEVKSTGADYYAILVKQCTVKSVSQYGMPPPPPPPPPKR